MNFAKELFEYVLRFIKSTANFLDIQKGFAADTYNVRKFLTTAVFERFYKTDFLLQQSLATDFLQG